eukprot:749761-Hanusia_phi.AAC.6
MLADIFSLCFGAAPGQRLSDCKESHIGLQARGPRKREDDGSNIRAKGGGGEENLEKVRDGGKDGGEEVWVEDATATSAGER